MKIIGEISGMKEGENIKCNYINNTQKMKKEAQLRT